MEEAPMHGSSLGRRFKISSSDSPPASGSRKLIFVVIFFVILIGIVFGVTRFLAADNSSKDSFTITPTPIESGPTEEPTEAITPTPSEVSPTAKPTGVLGTTDKSDITIEIQNGSGTPGEAGRAADILKALGYTISSTGNADSFDYEETVILVKPSQSSILAALKKDLSSDFTIGSASATLSSSSSSDALVIVGKE